MKLQNTLDLSTFEIVRFRIWNQTSIPDDFGLGTKYFNTNSGHEGYNRENIYTATGWRRAAYMDDIEAITNGEGSLGTRVKALEDMLNVDDVNDVINTWAEIQAFLDQVQEGTDLMTMLDGKLDKTGGTISTDEATNTPLVIKSQYDGIGWVGIAYENNVGRLGGLGFKSDGTPLFVASNKVDTYPLIHTGNALDQLKGTFLPLTGGTISSSIWANQLILNHSISGEPAGLRFHSNDEMMGIIYVNYQHRFMFHNGTTANLEVLHSGNVGDYAPLINSNIFKDDNVANVLGYSYGDSNGLNVAGPTMAFGKENYRAYLFGRDNILRFRTMEGGTLGDWKTLAFTDSTVEAAKKLETAVSLWGNEFDGTQSLGTANIYLANNKGIYGITTDSKYIIALNISADNVLRVGYGTNYSGETINTHIYGNELKFYTGTQQTAMTITEEGNVLVNHYDLEGVKFAVKGRVHIGDISSNTMALGQAPEYGLTLGIANLGMAQWVSTSGAGNIQSMAFNSATAYALNLNPLGGAVNVGEGGLNVEGVLSISNKITLSKNRISTKVAYTAETGGANYIWGYGANDYLCLGAGGTTLNKASASMVVESNGLYPGTTNAVSLGTSSFRWSNVYSVGGDFSGRVLIGGAQDDRESALQVKGDIKIQKNYDHFVISLRDVNVDYYGYDAADGWCNHNFISNGTTRFFVAGRDTEWSYIKGKFRAYGEFRAEELATFNGGALIPTGQKMTFGANGPTMEYDAENDAIKVTGNLYTTGTLSSGGKAEEGEGGTGGGSGTIREFTIDPPTDNISSFKLEHSFNTEKVIVQIFELNGNSGKYEMILTDVEITDANNVTVTFGRKPTEYHKVYVMA